MLAPYSRLHRSVRPNLQKRAPSSERWIHEIKCYGMHVHLVDGAARIYSRPGNDGTEHFSSIAATPSSPSLQRSTVSEFDGFRENKMAHQLGRRLPELNDPPPVETRHAFNG
jgi:hypothetical protein